MTCWGRNDSNQLGSGLLTDHTTPISIDAPDLITSVDWGATHSCGIFADGTTRCWGANKHGELGDHNPRTYSISIMPVFPLP
jgi:alpha-tubulin suppressor-like RCC1 family protein